MWLSPVGRLCFEELSLFNNQLFSFSTSNPEELGVAKFSRRIFHLTHDEIHPLVLVIPAALVFYCMFCVVVAVKTHCSVEYKLVNPFFNFHSPCLSHQNGVSHLLHAQGLPIGSLFLSPLSHSRRNLARWRRCDYPLCLIRPIISCWVCYFHVHILEPDLSVSSFSNP